MKPAGINAGINVGAMLIGGTAGYDQFGQAHPFVAQVFSAGGECVRIQVISRH